MSDYDSYEFWYSMDLAIERTLTEVSSKVNKVLDSVEAGDIDFETAVERLRSIANN